MPDNVRRDFCALFHIKGKATVFNVYPYSPVSTVMQQTRLDGDRIHLARIKYAGNGKDHMTMNSYLHALEAHVRAVNSRRLEEALKVEQIRLALANQPRGVNRIIASVRSFVGEILINAGKRMVAEPAARAA